MKTLLLHLFLLLPLIAHSQSAELKGQLEDAGTKEPISFANIAIYRQADSVLIKVETSDLDGTFHFRSLAPEVYYLEATYVGYQRVEIRDVRLAEGQVKSLPVTTLTTEAIELAGATVVASRTIVEVKPDRMVFNVEGTINSVGDNALGLLRKAPGVIVDNNNSISVLSRSGVLIYIDGKRLPLTGDDLSNYLQNIPAEQIDRIDIITNPGARYEAQGNAGILDIRLKKNKNEGANGVLTGNLSRGQLTRGNAGLSGNVRKGKINAFGSGGFNGGNSFMDLNFLSRQNSFELDETNRFNRETSNYDFRAGVDYFLNSSNTLGIVVTTGDMNGVSLSNNRTTLAREVNPNVIDSILIARNRGDDRRRQSTINLNYRYDQKGTIVDFDADFGRYINTNIRTQPNQYYDAGESTLLTEVLNSFDTPRDIDIFSLKLDLERTLGKGKLGAGSRFTKVGTNNTFLFYQEVSGVPALQANRSNTFKYDENVTAVYLSYSTPLGPKWNASAGLRAEHTDARGDLQAFLPEFDEDPVLFDYISWFPSAGLTWQLAPKHNLAMQYGRRINRPDYNVLNPFNNQLSELSFEKGNPFLRPEIVNNLELGYTLAYRYNFKVAYSKTTDQITRLIGPSQEDSRAGFITWDNLAHQTVWSANVSAPLQLTPFWSAFINASLSHLNNQANYGDGAVVDLQAWTYNIFQQHTFDLYKGLKGEVSGFYSGPGIWGGVFIFRPLWSLNLGLQKRLLKDKLNARLSVQDIFYTSGWRGFSNFNGLYSSGSGNWDSRQVSLSLSYSFGNQGLQVRKRKTGIEEASKRIGSEGSGQQ